MEKGLLSSFMTQSEALKVMFIQKPRIRKKNRKILHDGSTLMRAIFCGSSSVMGVYLIFSDKKNPEMNREVNNDDKRKT